MQVIAVDRDSATRGNLLGTASVSRYIDERDGGGQGVDSKLVPAELIIIRMKLAMCRDPFKPGGVADSDHHQ
jgi:hypothetical protein